MKLKKIKKAIVRWNACRKDSALLSHLLNQGALFKITIHEKPKAPGDCFLHAYPGVAKGKLRFFVIQASRDSKKQYKSPEGLLVCIDQVKMMESPEQIKPIPSELARKRVQQWNTNKNMWIHEQVQADEEMYQSFVIPIEDLKLHHEYHAFLALKALDNGATQFAADLVLWDQIDDTVPYPKEVKDKEEFFDNVRLVPPFSSTKGSREGKELELKNFFLLGLSIPK